MSCWIFISLYYNFALTSVPFLLIFAGGYFYVGFSSIVVLWKMHRESAQITETPVLPDAVEPT
jgi:hypothetical protein